MKKNKTTFVCVEWHKLDVMESWTKIFTVGPLPCLDYPVGAGKKGDLFFRKKDGGFKFPND
ncbi:hypothetical protein MTR_5g097730 [Medicago truncatula]|uniref:Uncharacterized protein n=1 Tax=Medicago truncatula TaxID=3880 RepID=G7K4X5_MEDTR|nr:hypothetical protein MTR_5g097730 [Medicago truncatula]